MKIMAIMAHPDDIEMTCSGTLANYANEGHEITMCNLCDGALGGNIPRKELAEIRKEEGIQSAKLIGAKYIPAIFEDLDIYQDKPSRIKVARIIRRVSPDIIITHPEVDYAPDHIITSKLVFEASFLSTLPNFDDGENSIKPKSGPAVPIYYSDASGGHNFDPSIWIDITKTFNVKKKMLSCHQSQINWLKKWRNNDILKKLELQAMYRGSQCGVKYAEVFKALKASQRIRALKFLP